MSQVLVFFAYEHLPPSLATISKPIHELAHRLADELEGPELTVGLRKLLEAKDCFVRAALPQGRSHIPGGRYDEARPAFSPPTQSEERL